MKIFNIHFFGNKNKKTTKYLMIKTDKTVTFNEQIINNALSCYQFDTKKEMDEYIDRHLSKYDKEHIEIYIKNQS